MATISHFVYVYAGKQAGRHPILSMVFWQFTLRQPWLPPSLLLSSSSSLASYTLLRRKTNMHTKQTHRVYITSNNTSNHMVVSLLALLLLLLQLLSIRNILMRIWWMKIFLSLSSRRKGDGERGKKRNTKFSNWSENSSSIEITISLMWFSDVSIVCEWDENHDRGTRQHMHGLLAYLLTFCLRFILHTSKYMALFSAVIKKP